MIKYKEVNREYFKKYDEIDMLVHVKSIYRLNKINRGLAGIMLSEEKVDEYVKDLGKYECAGDYEKEFDISNWGFYMAFDNDKPIGAVTIVSKTENVNMLNGRNDLAVLWDIRVSDGYKHMSIGQNLFDLAVAWCKDKGLKQLKIECQNNNVPACNFYHKQGAILSMIDEYAYYHVEECKDEFQLIWYLNILNSVTGLTEKNAERAIRRLSGNEDSAIEVIIEKTSINSSDAIELIDELSVELQTITGNNGRSSFDNNDMKNLRSIFVIAKVNNVAIGCGALRELSNDTAEIKRMYSRKKSCGIGGKILSFIEEQATDFGYSKLLLETRKCNEKAVAFYLNHGYKVINNYGKYVNMPEAVCFQKILK